MKIMQKIKVHGRACQHCDIIYFLIEVKFVEDHILQVQLAVHICVLVVRHLLQCVAFEIGFLVSKGFGYTVIYIVFDIPEGSCI